MSQTPWADSPIHDQIREAGLDTAEGSLATPACSPSWEGKRVIVTWTHRAELDGADWPSFVVIKELPDGMLLQGCEDPDGRRHDGSHCFAPFEDMARIEEWPFEENAIEMRADQES